ncbi:MAG: beta-ketoacyl synthase N-terminal-like domain-containing protein [Propionibacteriaceae bacterium]|nr:beta-ketoacyl synthase N-terminal-like domain-containing protein [Propionibacteriaceae bacterium]
MPYIANPGCSPFLPIAVLGAGCVLPPTSRSLAEYRHNLLEGNPGITPIPKERWNSEQYYSEDRGAPERTYCILGGFVDDYCFDPASYGLDQDQLSQIALANRTQLFAIDAALQALAAAGYTQDRLRAIRAELYLGNMLGDEQLADYSLRYQAERYFASLMADVGSPAGTTPMAWTAAWSRAADRLFGRSDPYSKQVLASALAPTVASAVGVTGGATLVDGACASGLLVVDVAISALMRDDLDITVAVGAMANMGVVGNVSFAKIGGLSGQGSHPLSAEADGLIPGEGAGAVVLKRLDRAIADEDPVVGVIRGAATRSDGSGKAIYAPSSRGQVSAMRAALKQAEVTACDFDYLEVHATGTPTGDATEIESIGQLISEDNRKEPLIIGSGKTLIGHGFPAAGIANLVKILLSLEDGRFFPTFGVRQPNQALSERRDVLRLLTDGGDWPRHPDRPRRAMANAFGFGGVDSSVLVEQYEEAYHRALVAKLPRTMTTEDAVQGSWMAVVGASIIMPGLSATKGLPGRAEFGEAWDALPGDGSIRDFQFPVRDVRIPPSTLQQTDRAQQLFLATSLLALRDAGLLSGRTVDDPERIATVVAMASGSEAALHRNECIRGDEFYELLSLAGSDCGISNTTSRKWYTALQEVLSSKADATTEAALPGYMDNIVAGRAGNSFDLRGTNFVVDSDLSSFGAAVGAAATILRNNDADAVLLGGVNAVLAPEIADAWSRQFGESVRLVEASVSLVVRRAADITDGDRVIGYLQATPKSASVALEPGGFTALGADGALWAFRHLLELAAGPDVDSAETVLRSVFQNAGYRLRVARVPHASPHVAQASERVVSIPETACHPVIFEGVNLADLVARLRSDGSENQGSETQGDHAAPGGLRLVFDLNGDDPEERLRQVASALRVV